MTTKQPQACPSLTPASTPPHWQIIWFSLAAICACFTYRRISKQRNWHTWSTARDRQLYLDSLSALLQRLKASKIRYFIWETWVSTPPLHTGSYKKSMLQLASFWTVCLAFFPMQNSMRPYYCTPSTSQPGDWIDEAFTENKNGVDGPENFHSFFVL